MTKIHSYNEIKIHEPEESHLFSSCIHILFPKLRLRWNLFSLEIVGSPLFQIQLDVRGWIIKEYLGNLRFQSAFFPSKSSDRRKISRDWSLFRFVPPTKVQSSPKSNSIQQARSRMRSIELLVNLIAVSRLSLADSFARLNYGWNTRKQSVLAQFALSQHLAFSYKSSGFMLFLVHWIK